MTKEYVTCHSRNTLLCSTLPKAPSLWACLEFLVETPNFFSSRLQRDIGIVRRGPFGCSYGRSSQSAGSEVVKRSSNVRASPFLPCSGVP